MMQRTTCRALMLPATDADTPPEWIPLLPAGPVVTGADGRSWQMPDAAAVVQRTLERMRRSGQLQPLVLDWEHGSELLPPQGARAPAAGWIRDLAVRDGEVWGQVEWTSSGVNDVTGREYRFISPAFDYTSSDSAIAYLTSAALTHNPNLTLPALNRREAGSEEYVMEPKILKALGLADGASTDDVLRAINSQKDALESARNQEPSLDRFVPRADYDRALNRAATAEKQLKDAEAAELEKAIEAEIDAAVVAGKVSPATVDYHRAQCRQEGGLERFREYVRLAPVIAQDTGLGSKPPPAKQAATGLDEHERAVCRALGLSEEEFIRAR